MRVERTDSEILISAGGFRLCICREDGCFTGLSCGAGKDLFEGKKGYVALYYPTRQQLLFGPEDARVQRITEGKQGITLELNAKSGDAALFLEIGEKNGHLRLAARAEAVHEDVREAELVFVLPVFHSNISGFVPHSDGILTPGGIDQKTYLYGMDQFRGETDHGMALPVNGFYEEERDCGFTLIAPVELKKPRIQYHYVRSHPSASFVARQGNLRLSRMYPAFGEFLLAAHEGDWRCSLKTIYELYPEYFDAPHPAIYEHEGTMICSDLQPEENIRSFTAEQGLKWQEVHANIYPYYGNYAPDQEEWENISHTYDVSQYDLKRLLTVEFDAMDYCMLRKSRSERISRKKVNDYIAMLHKYGVGAYMYMNAVIYSKWRKQDFPDAWALGADGEPCFKNHWMNVPMNPDLSTSFGKYILEQVEKIFQYYPECDGLFYDELHFREFDMNHDDGVSCVQDKPCYNLGFAIEKLNVEIQKLVQKYNKSIWANGPTSLEVMRYIDGLMAENSWTWLGTMQYFALNKPLVLLQHTQSTEELEDALRTAVVCGAQVHVAWEPKDKGGNKENSKMLPDSNPMHMGLMKRYMKLLDLLKRRKWYLQPHCIKVKGRDCDYNLFETQQYYAAALSAKGTEAAMEIELGIRELDEIVSAYAVTPEREERLSVAFHKIGEHRFSAKLPLGDSMVVVIEKEAKK